MGRATGMQRSNVTVDTNINTYISGVNVTQGAPVNTIGNRAHFDAAVNSIRTEHGNNGQAQADSMRRLLNGVVERFNVNGQFQAQQWREWMTYNFGADSITRL